MKIDEMKNLLSMWRDGTGLMGAGYGVLYSRDHGFFLQDHGIEVSPAYAEVLYRSGLFGAAALGIAAFSLSLVWRRAGPMGLSGHPMQPALFGALAHSAIDHPFLTVPGLVVIFWAGWGILERPAD